MVASAEGFPSPVWRSREAAASFGSAGRHAGVDRDRRSGDEAGLVAREEQRRGHHLLGPADPTRDVGRLPAGKDRFPLLIGKPANDCCGIGVSITPGQIALTRISGPSSSAAAFESITTPPFEAQYAVNCSVPTSPSPDEVFTIEARRPLISGTSSRIVTNVPRRFTFMIRSQSSSVVSTRGLPS